MSSAERNDDGAEVAAAFAAIRSGAAVSRLADRALLRARGEDRTSFLQGMLSNEIARLAPGQGTHALLLTDQGRVVADLRVWVLDEEIWLDAPSAERDDVRTALERYLVADDVELEGGGRVGLAVRGPGAADAVRAVFGEDAARLAEGEHRFFDFERASTFVARLRDLGVDAFHLWAGEAECVALERALREKGAVAAGEAAVEAQRVVAGVGRLGREFGRDTLAPEDPSLERAISYKKGCYLGQEVVERIAARGHVNWRIATLKTDVPVAPGDSVRAADAEVGRVTSAVRRPDDGSGWALARVRAAHTAPGTALTVGRESGNATAAVVAPEPS